MPAEKRTRLLRRLSRKSLLENDCLNDRAYDGNRIKIEVNAKIGSGKLFLRNGPEGPNLQEKNNIVL